MARINDIRCDSCGDQQEYVTSTDWVRVVSRRTNAVYDLCSWSCVRGFADARHAEEASRPIGIDVGNGTVVFS